MTLVGRPQAIQNAVKLLIINNRIKEYLSHLEKGMASQKTVTTSLIANESFGFETP